MVTLSVQTVFHGKRPFARIDEGQYWSDRFFDGRGVVVGACHLGARANCSARDVFYGNEGVDYSKVTAKVMGHFCEVDEWEPTEFVDNTFAEFAKAGVDATRHTYPGTAHWFVEEDRPEYDSAAAQLAWKRTFEFLKAAL
jgi:dienelactone hydrolase